MKFVAGAERVEADGDGEVPEPRPRPSRQGPTRFLLARVIVAAGDRRAVDDAILRAQPY